MPHVLELVASWVVTNALMFAIIILDERKILKPEQLERAWPPSSRDAAIIGFGPLALILHFVRTRGNFRSPLGIVMKLFGFVLGIVALAIVLVVGGLFLDLVFWVLGIPEPPG